MKEDHKKLLIRRPAEMLNIWLYFSTVIVWGSTWIALKYQVGSVPELQSIIYRFVIAASILLAVVYIKDQKLPKFTLANHLLLAVQGLLMFCLNYVLFFLTIEYIMTGLAAIAYTSIVIFNILMGNFIFKTRLTKQMLLGSGLGLIGILLVFWEDFVMCESLNIRTVYGFFYGLLGAFCASCGNMISGHMQRQGWSVLNNSAFGMVYGILWTLLFALIKGDPFTIDFSVTYMGSLIYLAAIGSAFAFWGYLTLLGHLGPGKAAYIFVMTPIIALILSSMFEGYEWSVYAVLGILVAVAGNVLILWRKR